jgi:hypothetical protein
MPEEIRRLPVYYLDYSWDLSPDGIKFDEELNIDKLGWKSGDLFEIANVNGKAMLRKVDPVVAFAKGYKINQE